MLDGFSRALRDEVCGRASVVHLVEVVQLQRRAEVDFDVAAVKPLAVGREHLVRSCKAARHHRRPAAQSDQPQTGLERLKIACLEEIALLKGFITVDQFIELAHEQNSSYGQYLLDLLARPDGNGNPQQP